RAIWRHRRDVAFLREDDGVALVVLGGPAAAFPGVCGPVAATGEGIVRSLVGERIADVGWHREVGVAHGGPPACGSDAGASGARLSIGVGSLAPRDGLPSQAWSGVRCPDYTSLR